MAGFKRARKSATFARVGITGPAGGGKSFSSGRIATGLGGPIAWIDTERGSAAKYADRFTFDVLELEDRSIPGYLEAIRQAADGGYRVLVIDSLTHAWDWLVAEVERIAKAKYRGNTWSAWSEGTPQQRRLVEAILGFPGHVIGTMRARTEWTVSENDRGGKTPVAVGLGPQQGKGIEYEFDLLLTISIDHVAHVVKDRSGRFQDRFIERPGEEFGRELAAWLSDGDPVEPRAAQQSQPPAPATDPRVAELGEFPDAVKAACREAMKRARADGADADAALDAALACGRELLAAAAAEGD